MNLKFQIVGLNTWQGEIPSDVSMFLVLGPKSSLQPTSRDINTPKLLDEIDPAINSVDCFDTDILLTRVTKVKTKFLHNDRHSTNALVNLSFKTKLF